MAISVAKENNNSFAKVVVFDSGLGGITVYQELKAQLPRANYLYIADRAAFPYGDLTEDALVTRLLVLFEALLEKENPDVCVIACNTASTIALAPLRDHFEVPFVGTVPAIKVGAEQTKTGLFSVLATPGTVKRDYTHTLIESHAGKCEVTLVGAGHLADFAEGYMRGEPVDLDALAAEIRPAFVEKEGRRTDMVALGCTHFPVLREQMEKVAPWPVRYIDPAPAIARQTKVVLAKIRPNCCETGACGSHGGEGTRPEEGENNRFIYTGEVDITHKLKGFLRGLGFANIYADEIIG